MSQVSARYDCSQLLDAVASTSSSLPTSGRSDLADEQAQTIRVFIIGELTLVVAFTPSCCYMQEFSGHKPVGVPMEICRFHPNESEETEEISCMTFVSLQNENCLLEDEALSFPVEIERSDEFKTPDPPTPHKSLLKGIIVGKPRCYTRVAIVIGTTSSRLYSVELRVDVLEWRVVADDTPLITCEVLPADAPHAVEYLTSQGRTPFLPAGGIVSLNTFVIKQREIHVWVVYGDGCMIRIRSAALFPSVWQKGALTGQSVDDLLGKPALLRCQVQIPPLLDGEKRCILPFYQSFPSMAHFLCQPSTCKESHPVEAYGETSPGLALSDYEDEDAAVIQAMVFSSHPSTPTLIFFTSEQQFEVDSKDSITPALLTPEKDFVGSLVGGTKALVGGVLGATLGVFHFGRKKTRETPISSPSLDRDGEADFSVDVSLESDSPLSPFPSLWREPIRLFAAEELHDAPRKLTNCTVAPDGVCAAAIDNLGRVLLFDLSTKQIVKALKGYRDAFICWIHADWPKTSLNLDAILETRGLQLAIHSRQRKTIEIFQLQLGSVIKLVSTDRGTELVPSFTAFTGSPYLAYSLLLRSCTPGTQQHHLDTLLIDHISSPTGENSLPTKPTSRELSTKSRRSDGFRLQYLRQLLSADAVQFTKMQVMEAVKAISSLSDLIIALDLLSKSALLEDKLETKGSAFHKEVVDYCQEILRAATQSDPTVVTSLAGRALSVNIQYHLQLIEAYDIVQTFQIDAEQASGVQPIRDSNSWSIEALGWIAVNERLTKSGSSLDESLMNEQARFSSFSSACVLSEDERLNDGKLSIYFSDSSRTRREILVHIFKPLLCGAFASNVVMRIFDALGIRHDASYIESCFGEWVLCLPFSALRSYGISAFKPPLGRFLQDIATQHLEQDDYRQGAVLDNVFRLCRTTDDLVRSFVLGTLSRNAIEVASSRKERLTYGKILAGNVVGLWESLLRKVRLSIAMSCRLKECRLVAPLTVANLDEEGLFSIYELVAMDLLLITRRNDEVSSLEATLSGSSLAFEAASEAGDDVIKLKRLQAACTVPSVDNRMSDSPLTSEKQEEIAPLLLFLPKFNKPSLLAAHHARLLAEIWRNDPKEFVTLLEAVETMRFIGRLEDLDWLALAVALDLWRSTVAPVYAGRLRGFQEVHEIDESLFGPLVSNMEWMKSLAKVSFQFLELMKDIPWSNEAGDKLEHIISGETASWPNGRTDHILSGIIARSEKVNVSAAEKEASVICCLILVDDIGRVEDCIPELFDCFRPRSLFSPVLKSPEEVKIQQSRFLEGAVIRAAAMYEGPAMDSFSLQEIELLGHVWEIDPWVIHTLFLQCMYEQGKDDLVHDLATKGTGSYDVTAFINISVDIVCLRLHFFLISDEMQAPDMRGTIGLLDADLCEWIQQRAKVAHYRTTSPVWDVPIADTHRLALRLLGLSTSNRVNPPLRVKIHALTVSSGVLVNALASRSRSKAT